MENLTVREMWLKDCSEVSRIVCASFRWTAEQEKLTSKEIDNYTQGRGSLQAIRVHFNEDQCWIATSAGLIKGLVTIRENEITKLYVDPPAINQGVGRKLFEEAERSISQDGHRKLIAWAIFDSAIPFYEAMGMSSIGRKFDILGKSEGMNTMLMEKLLQRC